MVWRLMQNESEYSRVNTALFFDFLLQPVLRYWSLYKTNEY